MTRSLHEQLEELIGGGHGVLAVSLVAKDGMPVDSIWEGVDLQLDVVAAEMLAQVQFIAESRKNLAAGAVSLLSLSTRRYTILLGAVSAEYYLLLVVKPAANYGRARFLLRRAVLGLSDEVEF